MSDEPIEKPSDAEAGEPDEVALYLKRAAERGRHEIVLGSIRAHLEEQPTANAVHSAARHWISDVTSICDEVTKAKRRSPR